MALALQIGWLEVGLAVSMLLLYIYYSWTSAYTYWERRNVPFLTPKFPFGNVKDVLLFKKNFQAFWMSVYNEMGDRSYCGIYTIRTPVLVVKDPELVKHILIKDFSHFTDHGFLTTTDHEPLLNNLFNMEGDTWKTTRAKLSPAFSCGKMKMMFPIMNRCTQQLNLSLENICKSSGTFEAKDLISRYAVDVIVNSVFGLNAMSVNDPDCDFYRTGKQIFERSLTRMVSNILLVQSPKIYSLLGLHFLRYDACEYFGDLIRHVIEDREKNNKTRNDFVDVLVRLKNNLSIDDADMFSTSHSESARRPVSADKDKEKVADDVTINQLLPHALIFFFAGFETTAATLSFSLYELSRRSELQLNIHNEVDAALQRHGGVFTYQMMQELPYIDNVINETLRLYSALTTLDRVCVKSYRIPGTDVTIEKGCKVAIPHYAIQHDPKYYPDPLAYVPDRFLEDNVKSRPSYTYMPFGEGPRMCIGMRFARLEMRLALATFFAKFSCRLNPATPVPLTIVCGEILTTTKDDILIDLVRREGVQTGS